ncbi:MAG: N-acetyltransferase [Actinomycetota bacterium]|nr:N-acetyltransferase [Actinomycetota bacterium]
MPPRSDGRQRARPPEATVRPEEPADFEEVRRTVQLAFGRVNEADLVERLRDSDYYVPELALVAERDGEIVGHVMLTYVELRGSESSLAVLSLAPLSVRPDAQQEGVGAALVERALARAEARREPLVVVLGHPRYYTRFGFEPARPHGIEPPPPGVPDEVWLVRLLPGYDGRQRGQVVYPPAFDGWSG